MRTKWKNCGVCSVSRWEKVRIGEVCSVVSGTTPKSNVQAYWNGKYNWVTPAELTDDTVYVKETQRKITQLGIEASSLKSFPTGTVLLSSRAPIGKVAITGTEMYCNQGFKNLICSDRIHNKYLYWFLKDHTSYLNSLGRGATFKEISKKIVEQIEIPLPPVEIQCQISIMLDAVSDLLNLRKKKLAELDKLIQSVFYDMFGNKDFSQVSLISLISDGAGLSYGIVQPGDDGTGNMGVIRPVDFRNGKIDSQNIKYINRDIGAPYKRTELTGNELLITVRGTTGLVALTDIRFKGMNVTRGIAVIRYDESIVNKYYLYEYLKTIESQRYIDEHTRGATLQQINLSDLRAMDIALPPLTSQNLFATTIQKIEEQKALVQQSIDETQKLFNSLMSEYFD